MWVIKCVKIPFPKSNSVIAWIILNSIISLSIFSKPHVLEECDNNCEQIRYIKSNNKVCFFLLKINENSTVATHKGRWLCVNAIDHIVFTLKWSCGVNTQFTSISFRNIAYIIINDRPAETDLVFPKTASIIPRIVPVWRHRWHDDRPPSLRS